jgi:hypothetical protein
MLLVAAGHAQRRQESSLRSGREELQLGRPEDRRNARPSEAIEPMNAQFSIL